MTDNLKWLYKTQHCAVTPLSTLLAVLCVGLFQANAIQFGMDQLLDASSSQLSSIHPLVLLEHAHWTTTVLLCENHNKTILLSPTPDGTHF